MGYCFDCIARKMGYENGHQMFTEMSKSLTPLAIAIRISVDYRTVLNQFKKNGIKVNTWGGRNVKTKGRFIRVDKG